MNAATDIESIALLDFAPDIKCESIHHATSEVHEGAAEFFQHGPCAHATGYRCGKYVRSVIADRKGSWCEFCEVSRELTFMPLSAN